MVFKTFIVTLPLLWYHTAALPAGTGLWPNSTVSPTDEVFIRGAYALIDTYDGTNWLSKFDVQKIADPTHGYVTYVDQGTAQNLGLLKSQGSQMYMGVDHTSILNPNGAGRNSVRVQSKKAYNHGLVIGDFAHIPGSNCGAWPAFWMVGPNWPGEGEIDVIEGVNLNSNNQVSLHTSSGCTPSIGPGGEQGQRINYADCGAGGGYNGCGVLSNSATSYGTPFNANGGGVYASLWTSSGIKVWYWAARNVPANIRNNSPDPNSWGTPMANFAGCNFDGKFKDMNIIFDITFCGDWAGSVWGSSQCAQAAPSCKAYVASQPQSFADTYWLVNSVKVYSA